MKKLEVLERSTENIKGTVTISLKDFLILQKGQEEKAKLEERLRQIKEEVTDVIAGFDDTEFNRQIKEIDDSKDMTDKQLRKAFDDAVSTLKIIVDGEKLKKLIHKYIDKAAGENHEDFANADRKTLEAIEIILKEGSR